MFKFIFVRVREPWTRLIRACSRTFLFSRNKSLIHLRNAHGSSYLKLMSHRRFFSIQLSRNRTRFFLCCVFFFIISSILHLKIYVKLTSSFFSLIFFRNPLLWNKSAQWISNWRLGHPYFRIKIIVCIFCVNKTVLKFIFSPQLSQQIHVETPKTMAMPQSCGRIHKPVDWPCVFRFFIAFTILLLSTADNQTIFNCGCEKLELEKLLLTQ